MRRQPSRVWMDLAACNAIDVDPDLFYPPKSSGEKGGHASTDTGVGSGTGAQWWPALDLCKVCPVRAECLTYAWETDQEYGIWGGLSPYSRTRLRTKRGKARRGRAA